MVTIIYWMAGIASDGGTYVAMTLTFVLSSQVSASLGYLLSVTGESIDTGTALAGKLNYIFYFLLLLINITKIIICLLLAPILIPLILFAGFFLNNSSIPSYFIWIKYLSWFYYSYDLLLIELWQNYGKIPCSTPNNITILCERYSSGSSVLSNYNVDPVNENYILFFFLS